MKPKKKYRDRIWACDYQFWTSILEGLQVQFKIHSRYLVHLMQILATAPTETFHVVSNAQWWQYAFQLKVLSTKNLFKIHTPYLEGGIYSPLLPHTTNARDKEKLTANAAHPTVTISGSPWNSTIHQAHSTKFVGMIAALPLPEVAHLGASITPNCL